MTGKAKTDITVLKMNSNGLASLRDKFEKFDENCMEYEDFIDDGEVISYNITNLEFSTQNCSMLITL